MTLLGSRPAARRTLLRDIIAAVALIVGGTGAALAQTAIERWEVFHRSSPCSPTLSDLFTVAKENPTGLGGSGFFYPARGSGNFFPFTPAGFIDAKARADAKRILAILASGDTTGQESYASYCCRNTTLWRQSLPGGGSSLIPFTGMGSPGPGFQFEAGPMCCEHAAIRAGTTAGCGTLKLSDGNAVAFTANGVFPVGGATITIGGLSITPAGAVLGAPMAAVVPTPAPTPAPAPAPPGPPVFGVAPQAPPLGPRAGAPATPPAPPRPADARVTSPPAPPRPETAATRQPMAPAEAYYVYALDHGIGLVIATQETVRTRGYCNWTGGGVHPCPTPASVVRTYGGPYGSVDAARADMRSKLDCERGAWGAFVRTGPAMGDRFYLQNNLGVGDCRSVKQHN